MRADGLRCHVVDGATAYVPLYAGVVQLYPVSNTKVYQAQPHSNAYKVLSLEVIVDDVIIMDNLQHVHNYKWWIW